MDTIIKKVEKNNIDRGIIQEAGELLKGGGLVAFPTETVYGLGANALDERAAGRIYAAKGRPSDNPLIVHIARKKDLYEIIAGSAPRGTEEIARHFWPGPLTMIFKGNHRIPSGTTGGLDTVAVRMPSNEIAKELILAGGGYISAPSANTSGRPSPTRAHHVAEDLGGKIEMIIDGGSADIGIESTILDMTAAVPMILRPGAITKEMLEKIVKRVEIDQAAGGEDAGPPKAPGMKYRHYAPRGEMVVVSGDSLRAVAFINRLAKEKRDKGYRVGIIAAEETASQYKEGSVKSVGKRGENDRAAACLYEILREFDKEGTEYIYSEEFGGGGMGDAVMNRLLKAAGQRVIKI